MSENPYMQAPQPNNPAPHFPPINPDQQQYAPAPVPAPKGSNPFWLLLQFSKVTGIFSVLGFFFLLMSMGASIDTLGNLDLLVLGMATLIMFANLTVIGIAKLGNWLYKRDNM